MINAKPTEIVALATELQRCKKKLADLTGDLASLRQQLAREWPDEKGEQVRTEVKKVEDLNAKADEALATQFNALYTSYLELKSYMDNQVGGGSVS